MTPDWSMIATVSVSSGLNVLSPHRLMFTVVTQRMYKQMEIKPQSPLTISNALFNSFNTPNGPHNKKTVSVK